jgi:hypothetical protein
MFPSESDSDYILTMEGLKNIVLGLKTTLEVQDSKTRNKNAKMEDCFSSNRIGVWTPIST